MAIGALSAALDSLNAFGFLEDLQARRYRQIVCYGPKAVSGEAWAGAVVWYRPRGYYSYKTLTLLGIWAYLESERLYVAVGTKTLAFSGPYYNAESYNLHIERRFDIYYDGDASPPPEGDRRYTTLYDPARRLQIRKEIEAELAWWGQEFS